MSNDDNNHCSSELDKIESSKKDIQYVSLNISGLEEETEEISIYELLRIIKNSRKVLYKTFFTFLILGLGIAFISTEEYTTNVKLIPESQNELPLGNLGSLASQFGISAAPQISGDILPANIYPEIIRSNSFLIPLMEYEVSIPKNPQKISFKKYVYEYQSKSIVRQMLLFPAKVKDWLTNDNEGFNNINTIDQAMAEQGKTNSLINMPKEDWDTLRDIRERISAEIDLETGIVTVSIKLQNPLVAADVADEIVGMLSEYVIENKTEKARRNVSFIEERFNEAQNRFEEVQQELAEFNDANRGQLTAMARTEEQLLQSEYNLNFNLYNTMAERLAEARIKLQEDTPVINILEPAAVPDEKSEPNRILILLFSCFFGVFVGLCLIFGQNILNRHRIDHE